MVCACADVSALQHNLSIDKIRASKMKMSIIACSFSAIHRISRRNAKLAAIRTRRTLKWICLKIVFCNSVGFFAPIHTHTHTRNQLYFILFAIFIRHFSFSCCALQSSFLALRTLRVSFGAVSGCTAHRRLLRRLNYFWPTQNSAPVLVPSQRQECGTLFSFRSSIARYVTCDALYSHS